jgi:protein-disulfide isomerase
MMWTRLAALFGASLLGIGCGRLSQQAEARAGGAALAPESVAAELEGAAITLAEVDQKAQGGLATIRQQEYEARRRALEQIIDERLVEREAKARGVDSEELLRREVDQKTPRPTQTEMREVYQQYATQLGGRPFQDVAADIEKAMVQQATALRRDAFRKELRAKAKLVLKLDPPRFDVPLPPGAPSQGPKDAPVTIVEYLDYQCPYCRRAEDTITAVLQRYGDKVRFVHRDFPIDGHPGAFSAARGARCAGDQGKFWEYHRGLFAVPGDYADKDLLKRAAAMGLDARSFETCLASKRHDADIRDTQQAGTRLGVSSTPTFFVNGQMVVGAQPLERFAEVIEAELARGPAQRASQPSS